MPSEPTPFDIVDLLDCEAVIDEYLSQVLADGDADEIIRAPSCIQAARVKNAGLEFTERPERFTLW